MDLLASISLATTLGLLLAAGLPDDPPPTPASRPVAPPEGAEQGDAASPTAQAASDPAAVREVRELWERLGGAERYADLHHLRFVFEVRRGDQVTTRRTHLWDRAGGRARIDLATGKGAVSILIDLETRDGVVLHDGEPVPEDEEKAALLEVGYSLWVNDSYWLAMPWKLLEPGVRLEMAAERELGDRACRRVRVSFAPGVGLTAGDVYHLWIDRDTGEMLAWEYHGERMPPEREPDLYRWLEWEEVEGVRFSAERRLEGGEQRIVFPEIEALGELDPALFAPLEELRNARREEAERGDGAGQGAGGKGADGQGAEGRKDGGDGEPR